MLALVGMVLVALVVEAGSLLVLNVLPRFTDLEIRTTRTILQEQQELALGILEGPNARTQLDSDLGWRYRPGFSSDQDQLNGEGARSVRSYDDTPPPGVLRITAFGDSFMYGTEVGVEDAWSSILEQSTPGVEILNFGVGGYGTDQAFLRYLARGGRRGEHVVLIGFAPVNLQRSVNVYRRFISDREMALVKPRFMLDEQDELILIPNPLPTAEAYRRLADAPRETVRDLGRRDFWYDPLVWKNPLYDFSPTVRLVSYLAGRVYRTQISSDRMLRGGVFNPDSEAFHLQERILTAFVDSVAASGMEPKVVIFPDRGSIVQFREGKPTIYAPLVEALRARGIEPQDLVEAFVEATGEGLLDPWFAPGGHYSELGNRLVAEEIAKALSISTDGPGESPQDP